MENKGVSANLGTPYANLDPNVILDAIESVGFNCTSSLFPLNSYENRVYQIGIEQAPPMIAKFYRPHRWSDDIILEEHQYSSELAALEIPVVAPWKNSAGKTLHTYDEYRFALFPRKSGRALELDNLEQLNWIGRFIGRVHAVGACRNFQHRPTLTVQTHGHDSYQYLLDHQFIPDHLKENYCRAAETVLLKIEQHFQQIGELAQIRLHGDMHAGNVLWSEAGPHIVDLDDCLMGPAVQDIWMLLSGDAAQMKIQLTHILSGYREFYDFNPRELKLIEPLRTLRMLRYSAWLARRWEDPAFPLNFPWFDTARYWQDQLVNLNEQIEILDSI